MHYVLTVGPLYNAKENEMGGILLPIFFLVIGFATLWLFKPILKKLGVQLTGGIMDYVAMGGLLLFLFFLIFLAGEFLKIFLDS